MDHEVNPLLKKPEHIGSGKLAMLAIYAATQDRFWQMNDVLFRIARLNPEIDIKKLAHDVGLDERKLSRSFHNRNVRVKLKKDILDGIKLGVRGTPSFVIDGKVYQGQIPPEILKRALE
jgi:protein-disulfide isomerase